MLRLFIAIPLPAPVCDALIVTMEAVEGARWQDDANLHLTLRFIGEVERPVANDLADRLSEVAFRPFPLEVCGVGAFERSRRGQGHPHALWAAVPLTPELEALRQKIERAAERTGLRGEGRRFTPHITLARLNSRSGPVGSWLAQHGDLSAGPWMAGEFVLYRSHLGAGGPHYEPVVRYRADSLS